MSMPNVYYASSTGHTINNKGDVIKLVSFSASGSRPFELFKVKHHDSKNWTYMMIIDNDVLPIVVSEKLAHEIIADPSIGGSIAYDTWYERHH